jgi:alkylated DNA nucleotide flippase Atl1
MEGIFEIIFFAVAKKTKGPAAIEQIDTMIRTIRGTRVMLDRDLAKIYGVPTKAFNQAVKRNRQRFPEDFMFRLTQEEAKALQVSRSQTVTSSQRKDLLRSQFVTSNQRGGPRYLPYAFTEYGALMAANIGHSRSPRSCQLPSLRLRLLARLPLARVLNSGPGRGR